jgi:two-component system response regulator CpxR
MNRILIIDDDEELCELVSEYLSAEGFVIEAIHDGESGLQKALRDEQDLVILDVMLPTRNGFDVLRELRQTSKIPVLMLTARGEDTERIVGLETGADDYLPKPFNPRELAARLRAILRRTEITEEAKQIEDDKLQVGDVEVKISARSATKNGEDLALTSIEFELLAMLLRNAGTVVKKEDLSEQVLERRLSPYDRSLDMHVSNLRKKLDAHGNHEERIKTVRSAGYIYTLDI